MIWLIFALMAALAVLLFFVPLLRTQAVNQSEDEIGLYRAQLAELDAALADGDMDEDDAAAARLEIERRIVAAPEAYGQGQIRLGVMPLVAGALITVAGAMAFYVEFGSPNMADHPAAKAGVNMADNGQDIRPLLLELEERLKQNPERADGWEILASSQFKVGRFADAANAYGRAAKLFGDRADLYVLQGESLVRLGEGRVTPAATAAFARASALNADHPAPKFYAGLNLMQENDARGALNIWRALAANSAADAPWMAGLRPMMAAAERQLGIGSDIDASSEADMINTMVARLRDRLASEGGGLEDWLKLARAEQVLGNIPAAIKALEEAYNLASGDEKAHISEQLKALKGTGQ